MCQRAAQFLGAITFGDITMTIGGHRNAGSARDLTLPPSPPPPAQARPQSQTSRYNSDAMPTPCLDKPVLARNTHNSQIGYVTATPGMAMLAMPEHHIQTHRIGL